MIKLAPSILSADFARLLEDVKKVENAGCEYLHIDVMDGHFVPNITLGPNVVKSLRKDVNMVFDAHLMIENPDQYIKEFVDACAAFLADGRIELKKVDALNYLADMNVISRRSYKDIDLALRRAAQIRRRKE